MPDTWEHPKLGDFEYEYTGWKGWVAAAALDAFTYAQDHDDKDRPSGKYGLDFDADDENELPSPEGVAVALETVANIRELVPKIVKALWDDFNDRGPDSGMWWRGALGQVAENMEFEDLPPPKKSDDLFKLLGLPSITVHKSVDDYDKPVVEISFAAAFEDEHGVGVLTDGREILGLGYSQDVTPFESE